MIVVSFKGELFFSAALTYEDRVTEFSVQTGSQKPRIVLGLRGSMEMFYTDYSDIAESNVGNHFATVVYPFRPSKECAQSGLWH